MSAFRKLNVKEHDLAIEAHHSEWGTSLTVKEYKLREQFIRQLQTVVPYGLIENEEILASTEVYMRKGILNNKEVDVWTVCTVFVPEEHRNKGYGTTLINGVVEAVNKANAVSVLFSDVGTYYERMGYETFKGQGYVADPEHFNIDAIDLYFGDLQYLPFDNDCTEFKIKEDAQLYSFHIGREIFYRALKENKDIDLLQLNRVWNLNIIQSNLWYSSRRHSTLTRLDAVEYDTHVLLKVGALIKTEDCIGYIIWTCLSHYPEFGPNDKIENIQEHKHLAILSINVKSSNATSEQKIFNDLLRAAQSHAFDEGLSKVVMWTTDYPNLTNCQLSDCWPAIYPPMAWKDKMRYTWC